MHEGSYYEATSPRLNLPPLAGDGREAEVAIIGGGFAGLATARGLQERGLRSVAVLEAGAMGQGASGRCGGFVFGGYSRDCAALLRELGPGPARSLYALTRDAVALIRRRIEKLNIACDRTEGGALLLDWFHGAGARAALRRQAQMMREQFGVSWLELSPAEVREAVETERYGAALLEPDAFHFHPLKYVHGLAAALRAEGASLYEQSPVSRIEKLHDGWRVHTAAGASLRARQLVLAGGATMQGLQRRVERSRLAIATYVMATEPLPSGCEPIRTPAALYDTRFAFDYYRMLPDRRLLWGGRISILEREPARIAALLRADLLRVYPQLAGLRIAHAWGGLMSYARHQMPQIGQLAPGLWFAQAFGGHGVAPTTVAGELLAEAIHGGAPLPVELERYGLVPVFGRLGLAAAQASYSWAELKDALRERLNRPA
ncbi:FAD-dependent oxidoreductase [Paucibacter sp. R3-3]|uniref:FAD-dependent oxidoreductase n=1 Tax=Roseateles agri TaxID=3098619 RepID=A0ABU5DHQ4_9BURK|nr:FAD-dependent oxidoreductase [Paucibacter sp. R3-3]MDY0745825.1 FAD-dependent oxidoreductase [Paucibacter sp. R3-3]